MKSIRNNWSKINTARSRSTFEAAINPNVYETDYKGNPMLVIACHNIWECRSFGLSQARIIAANWSKIEACAANGTAFEIQTKFTNYVWQADTCAVYVKYKADINNFIEYYKNKPAYSEQAAHLSRRIRYAASSEKLSISACFIRANKHKFTESDLVNLRREYNARLAFISTESVNQTTNQHV